MAEGLVGFDDTIPFHLIPEFVKRELRTCSEYQTLCVRIKAVEHAWLGFVVSHIGRHETLPEQCADEGFALLRSVRHGGETGRLMHDDPMGTTAVPRHHGYRGYPGGGGVPPSFRCRVRTHRG